MGALFDRFLNINALTSDLTMGVLPKAIMGMKKKMGVKKGGVFLKGLLFHFPAILVTGEKSQDFTHNYEGDLNWDQRWSSFLVAHQSIKSMKGARQNAPMLDSSQLLHSIFGQTRSRNKNSPRKFSIHQPKLAVPDPYTEVPG